MQAELEIQEAACKETLFEKERFKLIYKITKCMLLLFSRHAFDLSATNDDQFTRIESLNRDHSKKLNEL